MKKKLSALFAALVATAAWVQPAWAQPGPSDAVTGAPTAAPFQPIPPAEAEAYRFNMGRFYASPVAFETALKEMDVKIKALQGLKGKVIASPANLYKALTMSDDIQSRFARAYWYLDLQYSTDTRNTAVRNRAADLDAKYSPMLAFISTEIQEITPAKFQQFVKAEPRLKTYSYVIQEAIRGKPHTLSLKEEELLASVGPLMTRWQEDMFDLLLDRAPWGKVKDPDTGEELDVRQDAARLNNSPVREVRQAQYEKENEAYKGQRDLFAFDVLNVARTRNKLAQTRKFRNGMDASYFGQHLKYDQVTNAYNSILAHGDLRKRLQNMQRDRIQDFTGYETVHLYDMSMVPPGVEKPRFTINQASDLILDSVEYLGPEYTREMANLLDPKNGRLDIVPGQNRVANAFAIPSPGFESVFYSYGYQGYLNDVSTLAHEGGHVVNHALQENNKAPPALSDGPRYFTESYAILNELVLYDKLYREATDPGLKVYYLEQQLQQMMGVYGTVRIAAIEKAVYEAVDKGTVKTADDLDKLTFEIGKKTSIWHELDPETNRMWQQIPHYYNAPTYYTNYVFASLLAQSYFAQYQQDPKDFARRFTGLLRNGFNDTPENLLKKFMYMNLTNPKTFEAVFVQQEKYLNDLEALYREVPVEKARTAAAG